MKFSELLQEKKTDSIEGIFKGDRKYEKMKKQYHNGDVDFLDFLDYVVTNYEKEIAKYQKENNLDDTDIAKELEKV